MFSAVSQLATADAVERAAGPPSAQWEIGNIFSKLRVSSGFPLVSPPLRLGGIEDVRVHFLPGENWATDARAGKPKRKQAPNADGAKPGWANGGIRLKVNDEDQAGNLRFRLLVGSTMQGPFECDFREQSVQEVALDFDWRKELQGSGSLCLRLELL